MSGYLSSKKISPRGGERSPFLIIGEFPNEHDEKDGVPFTGSRKEQLDALLSQSGIVESSCRFDFLCPYRPSGNSAGHVHGWDGLSKRRKELLEFIKSHKDSLKCIILLGELPLQYLLDKSKIHLNRGSLFLLEGIKTIVTYSVDQLKRDASIYPHACFDFQKAKTESNLPHAPLKYSFCVDPSGIEEYERVLDLCESKVLANDVETDRGGNYLRCSGFAKSSCEATIFVNHQWNSLSTSITKVHERIFESPAKLILHNGTYDVGFFERKGIQVPNFWFDTMVAGHILNPEFPRSLAFLTSIYTPIPYYKGMVKSEDEDTKGWNDKVSIEVLTEYNGLDCIATFGVYEKQIGELKERGLWDLFQYEMSMLEVAAHISDSGMPLDLERRGLMDKVVEKLWYKDQELLNNIHRKDINVSSGPQITKLLYGQERDGGLDLPTQKKPDGTTTADEDAIVYLIGFAKGKIAEYKTDSKKNEWRTKLATLMLILKIRGNRKLLSSYIRNGYSPDGRVRSTIKVTGTETGRWSAAKYFDGTGLNAQTFPREVLEIPDEEVAKLMGVEVLEVASV